MGRKFAKCCWNSFYSVISINNMLGIVSLISMSNINEWFGQLYKWMAEQDVSVYNFQVRCSTVDSLFLAKQEEIKRIYW